MPSGDKYYGHHLTQQEMKTITKNHVAYDYVKAYLEEEIGAEIVYTTKGLDFLHAKASIATWEKVLHTKFHHYYYSIQYGEEGGGGGEVVLRASHYELSEQLSQHVIGLLNVVDFPSSSSSHHRHHRQAQDEPAAGKLLPQNKGEKKMTKNGMKKAEELKETMMTHSSSKEAYSNSQNKKVITHYDHATTAAAKSKAKVNEEKMKMVKEINLVMKNEEEKKGKGETAVESKVPKENDDGDTKQTTSHKRRLLRGATSTAAYDQERKGREDHEPVLEVITLSPSLPPSKAPMHTRKPSVSHRPSLSPTTWHPSKTLHPTISQHPTKTSRPSYTAMPTTTHRPTHTHRPKVSEMPSKHPHSYQHSSYPIEPFLPANLPPVIIPNSLPNPAALAAAVGNGFVDPFLLAYIYDFPTFNASTLASQAVISRPAAGDDKLYETNQFNYEDVAIFQFIFEGNVQVAVDAPRGGGVYVEMISHAYGETFYTVPKGYTGGVYYYDDDYNSTENGYYYYTDDDPGHGEQQPYTLNFTHSSHSENNFKNLASEYGNTAIEYLTILAQNAETGFLYADDLSSGSSSDDFSYWAKLLLHLAEKVDGAEEGGGSIPQVLAIGFVDALNVGKS